MIKGSIYRFFPNLTCAEIFQFKIFLAFSKTESLGFREKKIHKSLASKILKIYIYEPFLGKKMCPQKISEAKKMVKRNTKMFGFLYPPAPLSRSNSLIRLLYIFSSSD